MRLLRSLFLPITALLLARFALTQPVSDKVSWSGSVESGDVRAGEKTRILLTVTPKEGWHIYAMNQPEGPVSTSFEVVEDGGIQAAGEAIQPKPIVKFDRGFKMDIGIHEGPTTFAVPVSVGNDARGQTTVTVRVTSQACDATSCDMPSTVEVPVTLTITQGETRAERTVVGADPPQQPEGHVSASPENDDRSSPTAVQSVDSTTEQINEARKKGLFAYLWLSFVAGLLALATPCVWPMIPVTVSFFSKKTSDGKGSTMKLALAYCLGIMGTFTALGLIVTLIFGAAGLQAFAASPWVNVGLAVLFIVLALNLFGVYEIVIPSWMLNKATEGSSKSGIAGPIFMGLAFSITSFTCTVPFVGTILVTATKGNLWDPILGMLAFSLAFALPFFFLALFPQYLASMPKSGTWLTSVKAYMGFLELAAALKFLQSAEIVLRIGWLTRPVFLAIWFAILSVAGLYLLGWLRLPHDGAPKIGLPRRVFGVANIAAAFYLLAAIEGASLGQLAGFIPPERYPYRDNTVRASQPMGKIQWVEAYDEGLKLAKERNTAVFVNFTGYTCTNCRVMEGEVFPKPAIAGAINQFVPVELYTDDGSEENNKNAELREKLTDSSTNPTYVILTPQGDVLKVFQGLALSDDAFLKFLEDGKAAFDEWRAQSESGIPQ